MEMNLTKEQTLIRQAEVLDRLWRVFWTARQLGLELEYRPDETIPHETNRSVNSEYLPRVLSRNDFDPRHPMLVECLYHFLHRVKAAMDRKLEKIEISIGFDTINYSIYGFNIMDSQPWPEFFKKTIPLDFNTFHNDLEYDQVIEIIKYMLENNYPDDTLLEYVKAVQGNIPKLVVELGFGIHEIEIIHQYLFKNFTEVSKNVNLVKPLVELYRRNKILKCIEEQKSTS